MNSRIMLILRFKSGKELILDNHCTLDIQRKSTQLHINATNRRGGFMFNKFFEEIVENLSTDDESFDIIIKEVEGEGSTLFTGLNVNYYNNAGNEVLHFTKLQNHESME